MEATVNRKEAAKNGATLVRGFQPHLISFQLIIKKLGTLKIWFTFFYAKLKEPRVRSIQFEVARQTEV